MRLLLDTHAFLWLVTGDERLSVGARTTIETSETSDDVALSVASIWEAEIKRAAGRLEAPPIADAARRADVDLVTITAEHVTAAAGLPVHHRDPFDRLLVAQALVESRVLVTKDAIIARYGVAVAW